MKKWLSKIRKGETGIVLPAVLAMLVLGSLLIVPSLNYASTNLKAANMVEEDLAGLYTADAGVEDALWRLSNDKPASFPYSYQITGINGMTVDVTIDEVDTIAGEEVRGTGQQSDRLIVSENVTYDSGFYFYNLSLTSNHNKPIKIDKILIDFPPELDYEGGTTSGNITSDNPDVTGNPTIGITLVWICDDKPTIPSYETEYHRFELSGPPGIEGVEGHGFVEAHSQDIGTVWVSEVVPYSITAQAKDATDAVVATIRAGVWGGSQLKISCWQVNP